MKSDKAFSDRVKSLIQAGSTTQESHDIARKEFRALNEARRAIYRKAAIKNEKRQNRQMRDTPSVTPRYGLSSRIGKIDQFSKYNKPSQGLADLRRDLDRADRQEIRHV